MNTAEIDHRCVVLNNVLNDLAKARQDIALALECGYEKPRRKQFCDSARSRIKECESTLSAISIDLASWSRRCTQ